METNLHLTQPIMVAVANSVGTASPAEGLVPAMTGMAGVFAALLEQSISATPEVEGVEASKAEEASGEGVVSKGDTKSDTKDDTADDAELVQCLVGASVILPGVVEPEVKVDQAIGEKGTATKGDTLQLVTAEASLSRNAIEPERAERNKDEGAAKVGSDTATNVGVKAAEMDCETPLRAIVGEQAPKPAEPKEVAAKADVRRNQDVESRSVSDGMVKAAAIEGQPAPLVEVGSAKENVAKTAAVVGTSMVAKREDETTAHEQVGPVVAKPMPARESVKAAVTAIHAGAEGIAPSLKDGGQPSDIQAADVHAAVASARADAVESPSPRTAMNTERLVEHLAGSEMKFTVRLNDAGQVRVVTNLHDRTIQVGVVTDRAEAVSALRSEVPYLEGQMRRHALELGEVKVSFQNAMSMDAGLAGEQRSRQEWRSAVPVLTQELRPRTRIREEDPVAHGAGKGRGQLSLLA